MPHRAGYYTCPWVECVVILERSVFDGIFSVGCGEAIVVERGSCCIERCSVDQLCYAIFLRGPWYFGSADDLGVMVNGLC